MTSFRAALWPYTRIVLLRLVVLPLLSEASPLLVIGSQYTYGGWSLLLLVFPAAALLAWVEKTHYARLLGSLAWIRITLIGSAVGGTMTTVAVHSWRGIGSDLGQWGMPILTGLGGLVFGLCVGVMQWFGSRYQLAHAWRWVPLRSIIHSSIWALGFAANVPWARLIVWINYFLLAVVYLTLDKWSWHSDDDITTA